MKLEYVSDPFTVWNDRMALHYFLQIFFSIQKKKKKGKSAEAGKSKAFIFTSTSVMSCMEQRA